MTQTRSFIDTAGPSRAAGRVASPRGWLRPFNPPLRDWQGLRVWLVGASSGIGEATADALHARGARVIVSARKADALDAFVQAHPGAQARPLDVTDAGAVACTTSALLAEGPLDLVVYCAGHYQAMRADAIDLADMHRHMDINYSGALNVMAAVLPGMIARGQGHLSLISSVAGFRGLPKSLAYGPTKAALTHLAENLYLDLQPLGVGVSAIHPGFVQTPLTAGNNFEMPALITPAQAAQAMLQGWARGDFDIHFPRRFTRWMKLLRLLPYRLYFPLVRRFTGL
ncbi:MAG: SDR family NAD(P)-dependent oxidoreductase [Burkholderiales bacterium]|nr:MAG: SDR family NAD(P)-dependent oxidoreductase [Burkholderiales bacterium]